MEIKRFVVAFLAALAVFFLSTAIISYFLPPPPPPGESADGAPLAGALADGAQAPPTASSAASTSAHRAATLRLVEGGQAAPIELGGRTGDDLAIAVEPRGGGISWLRLTQRDARGRFLQAATPDREAPYELLRPIEAPDARLHSYVTASVRIDQTQFPLADALWEIVEAADEHVVLRVRVEDETGNAVLELRKTYRLTPGKPLVSMQLELINHGSADANVSLEQDGPLGVARENPQYDMRRLVWASRPAPADNPGAPGEIQVASVTRGQIASPRKLGSSSASEGFFWTALGNRYFMAATRPLPHAGQPLPDYLSEVKAMQAAPAKPGEGGDMLVRFITKARTLQPGAHVAYAFEIYAGTKIPEALRRADPALADRDAIGYVAVHDFDKKSCFCSFLFLNDFMSWLLDVIYAVVRNYGVAIMILVVIVRTLLHPLAVFQQKSMFKMQEVQVRLGPKLAAIREQYKGDAVAINRETMKIYAEENVNPAASMVGMLPMFLQMPILIALWTALNTNVHLRHAGFDGWWIRDLSNPDALIHFGAGGLTIPLLGQLIPSVFANIPSFNLLPILMGLSMYLQHKYMPKPHLDAQKAAARENPQAKNALGMTVEDQIRQQEMMGVMMSVLMPLMFYYMPSGLNLYWMSTNVFGIFESIRIRKQIDAEKLRRAAEPPKPAQPAKPSIVARFLKSIAEQAEEMQKKADSVKIDDAKSSKRQRREKKARS